MDLKPLTSEEVDAVRALAPWVKVFGTGTFLSMVVGLWKIFGLYQRLADVEEQVRILNASNLLTTARHEELAEHCKTTVDAKIEKAIHELHLKWLDEMGEVKDNISSIKETHCHLLGELKQITNILKQKD